MRSMICLASTLLVGVALACAQDVPKSASISDVTVSAEGDATGLGPYLATLRTEMKKAWIDEWHFGPPDPGRLVQTLRINHAGYLGRMDGSEFVPAISTPHRAVLESTANCVPHCDPVRAHRIDQISSASRAVERVFTGLPPEPPQDYPNAQIIVKVTFVYGTEKPQLQ